MMAEKTGELPRPEFDEPPNLLLVAAPFYRDIADMLLAGARAEIAAAGATHEIVEVPGALEIGPAIAASRRAARFDGYVALGCVIRGETGHYDIVAGDSSRALTDLGLAGAAIGNGILTVETMDQARVRADPERLDKGGGAAAAALHLVAIARRFPPARAGFHADFR